MANEEEIVILNQIAELEIKKRVKTEEHEKAMKALNEQIKELKAKLSPLRIEVQREAKPFNPLDRHPPGNPPGRPR
jgi:uncharacterized coiled-coil DUF342 family protein